VIEMQLSRRALLSAFAASIGAQPSNRSSATEVLKRGGILRAYHPGNPASMSPLEESTVLVITPSQKARVAVQKHMEDLLR